MPMVSTMPMMPGSVSVALSSDSTPKIIADVDADRDAGEDAEQAVGHDHEHDHERRAVIGGVLALLDRILAEARADDALLDDRQRRRQCAGAQQDGEIVRRLDREAAGNLARARRIGSRITGAEITSLSSTMANGRPTFSCVACANLRAPEELKRKLTIGSLVRWSKPGCASVRSSPDTRMRFSIR